MSFSSSTIKEPVSMKNSSLIDGFEDNFVGEFHTNNDKAQACKKKTETINHTEKDLVSGKKTFLKSTTISSSSKENDMYSGLLNPIPSPLQCFAVRLTKGDELRKSLLAFIEKNNLKAAFVISCIGSASSARLRMANYTSNQEEANYMLDLTNNMEIISVSGTLSGGGHLHISLSDHLGKVVGGHLLELVVDTTAEVVIGDCSALQFRRGLDSSTGFKELQVDAKIAIP